MVGYLHVQLDNHGITILYHFESFISVYLAHHKIFRAKVGKHGKGGINLNIIVSPFQGESFK